MILDERVGEPDPDERLSGDAEPPGFLIDLAQEVHRDVHVHALDCASGSLLLLRTRLIEMIRIRSPRMVMSADHSTSDSPEMTWVRGSSKGRLGAQADQDRSTARGESIMCCTIVCARIPMATRPFRISYIVP
jgi:hypothetical protein